MDNPLTRKLVRAVEKFLEAQRGAFPVYRQQAARRELEAIIKEMREAQDGL